MYAACIQAIIAVKNMLSVIGTIMSFFSSLSMWISKKEKKDSVRIILEEAALDTYAINVLFYSALPHVSYDESSHCENVFFS